MVTRCPVVVEQEPVVENCENDGRIEDAKGRLLTGGLHAAANVCIQYARTSAA